MASVGGSNEGGPVGGVGTGGSSRLRRIRALRSGVLLAALALASACSTLFQEPEARIVGIRVVSLGVTGGIAAVDLEVSNPNDRAVRVLGLRYRLQVEDLEAGEGEWSTLSEGSRAEGVTLEPRDSVRVSVDVPFEYRIVGATIRALLRGRDVEYRLDGEVRIDGPVGEIRVPVRTTGLLER